MKPVLAMLVLLLASACSGPEVPTAFRADSPASPDAPPASRMSVAAVLAAPDPLDARVCAPDQACVLGETPKATPASGGHQHGGHDHSGHSQEAQPPAPAAPHMGHEHHSGHNH